ncbi:UPF0764 protein C16orf89 like [Pseudolycoriella hygida]|uniref:UPF0764 protein C16orf89 like n=1 Tax=Pseudolycoriella hygida TaxID=35572 RepID=A0A9Q0S558_9DIPT|nr:UPF0764 protein C16orf89 like [Pseudolycoriella hygida]
MAQLRIRNLKFYSFIIVLSYFTHPVTSDNNSNVNSFGTEEAERGSKIDSLVKRIVQNFDSQMETISNGPSLKEDMMRMTKNITFPSSKVLAEALRTQRNLITHVSSKDRDQLESEVLDSIIRTLKFYEAQLDDIVTDDSSLTIKMVKDADDKHGKVLQQNYPLDEWIQKLCLDEAIDNDEETFNLLMVQKWKSRSGKKTGENMDYWKPSSVLQNYIDRVDHETIENIGDEKEGLWGVLNGQCQGAWIIRCEIPYICERTLLDPTPRSQYLLTHQILQRLVVENGDCPKFFLTDDEIYANMCTKSYMEAQFLDLMEVPINHRDLFAELVGFCAFLGYTNFLRVDWLHRILSWQSASEYGCFIRDPQTPIGLVTSDMGFKRRATKKELDEGVQHPGEKCLPHLTAVSLTVISVFYDYLMDLKSRHLRIGEHIEL